MSILTNILHSHISLSAYPFYPLHSLSCLLPKYPPTINQYLFLLHPMSISLRLILGTIRRSQCLTAILCDRESGLRRISHYRMWILNGLNAESCECPMCTVLSIGVDPGEQAKVAVSGMRAMGSDCVSGIRKMAVSEYYGIGSGFVVSELVHWWLKISIDWDQSQMLQ